MEHIIKFFGRRDLVDLAAAMFGHVDRGGIFSGVSPDTWCLVVPKSETHCHAYRLTLRHTRSGKEFETCGYGSDQFLPGVLAFQQGGGQLEVGGRTVHLRKSRSASQQYEMWIEKLDR